MLKYTFPSPPIQNILEKNTFPSPKKSLNYIPLPSYVKIYIPLPSYSKHIREKYISLP